MVARKPVRQEREAVRVSEVSAPGASELELVIYPPGLFFSRLSESPCA